MKSLRFVDETDLATIALSCRFALDLLCDKENVLTILLNVPSGTIARGESPLWYKNQWHPCGIDLLKSRAGLRLRLLAEQVFVSGWEIFLNVHRLKEIAISYTVHSEYGF